MAITNIAATGSATNVVTLVASITAGDIVIFTAVRHNSTAAPGTPTGATLIANKAAATGSIQMSWLVFTAGGTTVISSANATHLGYAAYRGQTASGAIGGFTASASDALSQSIAVLLADFTQVTGDGTSMIVGGYFHNRTSDLSAVTGMTERFDAGSASIRFAMSDGLFADFTVRTAAASAARDWASITVEIKDSSGAAPAGPGPNAFTRAMTGCGLKWIVEEWLPLPPFGIAK